MATTDLGKIGIVAKGDWSDTTAYEKNDVVYYNGDSYIAKTDVTAGTLPTNTTYWAKLADGYNHVVGVLPYSWEAIDSSNTTGYMLVARIKIRDAWADGQITVRVARRMDERPVSMYVRFAQTSSTDPTLAKFNYDSLSGTTDIAFKAFIVKTDTSTWDIYVQKQQANDSWLTVWVDMSGYMGYRCDVYKLNYHLNSVPSGATYATPLPSQHVDIQFTVPASGSKTLTFPSNTEVACFIACTGWHQNLRSGLWFIGAYSDSSHGDITTLKSASGITITAGSGFTYTINNSISTVATFGVHCLWGGAPTVS